MTGRNTPSPVLEALREATSDVHADLDRRSPLTGAILTPETYVDHAERVMGWMKPIEQGLWRGEVTDRWPDEIQAEQRDVKVQWIERDLLIGGYNAVRLGNLPICPYAPVPLTLPAAFGVAYVSEGATLGGAFLFDALAKRLSGVQLHWLQGYGKQTGPLWRSFQRLLAQQVVSPRDILEAQNAARAAFESFRCWVIDEKPYR